MSINIARFLDYGHIVAGIFANIPVLDAEQLYINLLVNLFVSLSQIFIFLAYKQKHMKTITQNFKKTKHNKSKKRTKHKIKTTTQNIKHKKHN